MHMWAVTKAKLAVMVIATDKQLISKSLVLLAIILFQCANAINVVWIGVTRRDWVSLTLHSWLSP